MTVSIITIIFLFITFSGLCAGIYSLFPGEGTAKNIAFIITVCTNTFFSVLNIIILPPNDYPGLTLSSGIIIFAVLGTILRFLPIKASKFSPILVFSTMIISMIFLFR